MSFLKQKKTVIKNCRMNSPESEGPLNKYAGKFSLKEIVY
jgi:hypothetical protein